MLKTALVFAVLITSSAAHAETYWLWAIDGRFEESKSPCADAKRNPARLAIYDFIGSETYVRVVDDELDLLRGEKKVVDVPAKRLVGPDGSPISIWYRGLRTWIVTLYPKVSPAFASVTLVMEKNEKRKGKYICRERWVAPVSP